MGLGTRGKQRIEVGAAPKVKDLFTPTEASGVPDEATALPGRGRPKGESMKPKTFTLPVELAARLRKFAFLQECKEVDVVRAALTAYLDAHE